MTDRAAEITGFSDILRFGIPADKGEARSHSIAPGEAFRLARASLDKHGFRPEGENGENLYWLGFVNKVRGDRGDYNIWQEVGEREKAVIASGGVMPKEFLDAYKICIDIEPSKLPGLIRLLKEQFGDIPFSGKIAKPSIMGRGDFPKLVLYLGGADKSEALDFGINLAMAVRIQLGGSDAGLTYAKELEPCSGVFLTQGDFTTKR